MLEISSSIIHSRGVDWMFGTSPDTWSPCRRGNSPKLKSGARSKVFRRAAPKLQASKSGPTDAYLSQSKRTTAKHVRRWTRKTIRKSPGDCCDESGTFGTATTSVHKTQTP